MTPQPDLPAEVAADAMDGIRCALLNNGESLADYDTIRAHIASLERQLAEARVEARKLALDAMHSEGEAAAAYAAQQAAERQLAEVTARADGLDSLLFEADTALGALLFDTAADGWPKTGGQVVTLAYARKTRDAIAASAAREG